MKQRTIFGIMTIVALIALTLTACPPGPDPDHTHTYSTTWSKNATQHWHECNCGDKKDAANHSGNPCTVCGYSDPTHTHTYATAWSSNAAQHWHECSCGDKKDIANHTGDPCTVCGYTGSSVPPTCVCPPNTEHPYGTDCPSNCEAKGTEHCGCTFAPPPPACPCPANTVHPYGTTCPGACVGVGHEGCNCQIGAEPVVVPTPVQINNLFVDGVSVTIKGTFTNTEWPGIWNQVVNALNNAYSTSDFFNQLVIEGAFNGATITIVNETATWTYKTVAGESTSITINIGGLTGLTSAKLLAAAEAMGTDTQARAPGHDNGWERMNREAIAFDNRRARVANSRSIG